MWRRQEALTYDGKVFQLPLPAEQGTGLGKPLKLINHPYATASPSMWASLMGAQLAADRRSGRRLAADLLHP